MTREDFNSPVAAAATAQVKLCPYDEEEPHIWFRLIEAQFAAAGIKSQWWLIGSSGGSFGSSGGSSGAVVAHW
jgi:hypothetical protein